MMVVVVVMFLRGLGVTRSENQQICTTVFESSDNYSNTEQIYTKYSFMESLVNCLALENKTKTVDLLKWQHCITDS